MTQRMRLDDRDRRALAALDADVDSNNEVASPT
jgi:hypothetical protein